jgi:hypothetical protein
MSPTTDVALPIAPDKRGFTWFDSLFGVLMPIICFIVDLSFLNLNLIAPFAFWGVAVLGIFAFILARFRFVSAFREIILGMLWSSAVVAALIGIALIAVLVQIQVESGGPLPPLQSIFTNPIEFAIVGAGLSLVLVPLFTAKAFCNRAAAVDRRGGGRRPLLIALGALIAVGLPFAAHGLEYRWLTPRIVALRSNNPEMRLAALRDLNSYPILLDRAWGDACNILKDRNVSGGGRYGYNVDDATMCEIERMVGPDPERICSSSSFIRARPTTGASSSCQQR